MKNRTEKRCIIACKVLWREISHFAASSPYYYDIYYLEQGLHDEPARLKEQLQDKLTELEESYSIILIGYGLCSNGIVGIRSASSTLVFMRGHDCITFFLGSKERYRRIFDEWPGTYWYTTGWIETSGILNNEEYYQKKYSEYLKKYDDDTAQYLIDSRKLWFKNYKNIGFIQEKITEESEFKRITQEAASYSELDYKEIDGDMGLIRDWIYGNWSNERFLILEPEQSVAASFQEETIIQGERTPGMQEPWQEYQETQETQETGPRMN